MKVLHYGCDVRSVLVILLAVTAYTVQWAGILRHPAIYVASFFLAFFACVINHNHQHHPTFVPGWLNSMFSMLISLAMGVPATGIVPMHNFNHHVHNNHAEDCVRASIMSFQWNFLNLLFFPFVVVAGYARIKSREIQAWREERPRLYRQVIRERCVLYPVLLALLCWAPLETLIYFMLPYLYGQWGILAINHLQHDGCDPDSEWNHSRNFVGRWLNWWVFNNGYHTAHHLHPGLHWSLVPKAHEEIRDRIDAALERQSLLGTAIEFYIWPARKPVWKGTPS
jgi:fatty acid desaturase